MKKQLKTFLLYGLAAISIGVMTEPSLVQAQASRAKYETSGWFGAKVDYVSDMVIGCAPGEASIEYQISEYNSKNVAPGVVNTWRLIVRDENGIEVGGQYVNGQKNSQPICFDPNTMSTQVTFDKTDDYYGIETPAVEPTSDLSSMAGFHFKGYVHVKSAALPPDIEAISPVADERFNRVPNFVIRNNFLPSLYNVTAINNIKFYAINATTFDSIYLEIPVPLGVGTFELSSFPDLPEDGRYYWTFHQDYNGSSFTQKPASVFNWNFSPLPASGATSRGMFVLDRGLPTVTNATTSFVTSPRENIVTTILNTIVLDELTLVEEATLHIFDSSDVLLGTSTYVIPYSPKGQNTLVSFTLDLEAGNEYKYFVVAVDEAGNAATSSQTSFNVPLPSEFTAPELGSWPPEAIRSDSARLRSRITDTGNTVVSMRGTCWALTEPSLLNQDVDLSTNCVRSSGTFSTGIFLDAHTGLPANSLIFYRGFARNAGGTSYSPVRSFTTQPSAFATSTDPLPPVVGISPALSIGGDNVLLQGFVASIGGGLITSRAICWAVAESALPTEPKEYGSSCYEWVGGLPPTASLPDYFTRQFDGLSFNTNYHFRVFATNEFGTSYDSGVFFTQQPINDFAVTVQNTSAVHDDPSSTYNFDVTFDARDMSNHDAGQRTINYAVNLRSEAGAILATRTGTINSRKVLPPTRTVSFSNIPYGLAFFEVIVNTNPTLYPEPSFAIPNNSYYAPYIFRDPDEIIDIISGGGGGSGPTLPDPGFELEFPLEVVRSGFGSQINWDTKVPYPMNCRILGPTTFADNGVFTFDPSVDGVTGSIETGPLTSAQTFEITCVEPVTNSTFSTTTRIDVAGKLQES